ncbi:MAG: flagellar export chaperone FliS [Planctomycetota bacterium]
MDARSAALTYQAATFETAPPLKIVHLMYEGALKFLARAGECDPAREPLEFNRALRQAEAVVSELRLAVAPEHAPALAGQLEALYRFVEDAIREALLSRSTAPLAGAAEVLRTLLDAWRQIGGRLGPGAA